MGLESLNKRAASQFDRLKEKQGWTKNAIAEVAKTDPSINEKKIQRMLDEAPKERVEVDDIVYHGADRSNSAVVSSLDFIDSLELPANLSIAIACLISYKRKGDRKSLLEAQEYIRKELENG